MASRTSQQSYAAFFEDFDEDANVTIPETRTVANVAAKRSKADIQQSGTSTDGASDSGYSSRTAATVGSADSLPTGKRSPPFIPLDTVIANRDIERVRGRPDDKEKEKTKPRGKDRESRESNSSSSNGTTIHASMHRSSSRPAPKRSSSKARKWEATHGRHAPDTCLDCDQYGYRSMSMGPPPLPPPPDLHNMDYGSYMHPHPQSHHGYDMPSPSQPYHYPPIVTQEIISSRRDRSNSYHQSRPMSFHAGTMPDMNMYMHMASAPGYEQQQQPQQPQQQHGPPISASAYAHYMSPYMTNGPVAPSLPSHMSYESAPPPNFERVRAASTPRSPEKPTGRRASMYGTPVVEYHPSPSHRSEGLQRKTSSREVRARRESQSHSQPPPQPHAYDPDEDFYRMPPPPLPKSKPPAQVIIPSRRPPARKAATAASTPTLSRRPEGFDMDDLRAALPPTRPGRKKSREAILPERRPSASGKVGIRTTSYHDPGRSAARISIETTAGSSSSSRRRRSSVYGVEQSKDLDQKQREAEEYQSSRTCRAPPLTLDSLVKSRRSHRGDSDSGSLRTRTDSSRGSDAKTKSGISRPAADDDEITVMIGGLRIGVPKDNIEHQVINLRSGEEGSLEVNIEGRRPKRYLLSRSESLNGGGGRREIEENRRLRHDTSSDRASRRSSRSGYSGRGLLES